MGLDLRASMAAEGTGVEAQLQHAIERDVRAGQERSVLALHVSRLQPPAPRAYHRRIAKAILDDAAQLHAGQVFVRNNADFVLIWDGSGLDRLQDTLVRLFRVDSGPDDHLVSVWTLPNDAAALETYLSRSAIHAAPPEEPRATPGPLGAMEALLGTARLTDLIHRQMAAQIVPGGMSPLFRELTFSMDVLESPANGNAEPQTDLYLFQHLVGRLDIRMMDVLAQELRRPGALPRSPALHLNLTVRAILSPGFLNLAAAAAGAGTGIGVEVTLLDACADPLAFAAARMVLTAHGATVVLDNIAFQALLLSRPEQLSPDLLKLEWTPRLMRLPALEQRLVTEALLRIGEKRVVLHRVGTAAGVQWGLEHGITRFQGRHIDTLLAAGRLADCSFSALCTQRQCAERAAATGAAGRSGCRNTARLDSPQVTQAVPP